MSDPVQMELFGGNDTGPACRKSSVDRRRDPLFLRNQFPGEGKWGIPLVRKQEIPLDGVGLLACTNMTFPDHENFDLGIHHFVDDYRFDGVYEHPEKSLRLYRQYRFVCTPDCSVYGDMQPWRQLESVARSRWVGAYWQRKGLVVVPTVSWDAWPSFEFCFSGIKEGCVVAVATYACRQSRSGFLRGYAEMLRRVRPEAVICYGDPIPEMGGNVIFVPAKSPRQLHRDLPKRMNCMR